MSESPGAKPDWWLRQDTWDAVADKPLNLTQARDLLLAEGLHYFETKFVVEYPFVVDLSSRMEESGDMFRIIEDVTHWIEKQGMDAKPFPTEAIGRYKDYANCVMCRTADDAMLVKLTWL